MDAAAEQDRIDFLIASLREIPGLSTDPTPIGILTRMSRISDIVGHMLAQAVCSDRVRTKKDHDLLVVLLQAKAPLRNRELEKLLYMTAPTVSQRVNRLVATGLINRAPVPHDTRANQLTLTDDGRELTLANVARAAEVHNRILETTFTQEERFKLGGLLRAMTIALGDHA